LKPWKDLNRWLRIIIVLFIIFLCVFIPVTIASFWPRTETVKVLGKIQKKSGFTVPIFAEDVLVLEISTDKGYFYVRGEFDADGIRHIFKAMEIGKTYEIWYFGLRWDQIYMYPFISSFREVT
jgi:hypothetical protein